MNQNAPRGCAARGDEVYAEHTARARKCATSAHFIYCIEFEDQRIRFETSRRLERYTKIKEGENSVCNLILKALQIASDNGFYGE